ncbi:MAG: HAD family hydrolase [Lachnospiraceae bacterium]|nr:HAD family hydrolase [Lachnospiraceae bacterium]
MIRAVIFDMYETLITHYHSDGALYFSPQMAADAGAALEKFQAIWRGKECERTVGKLSLEETLTLILEESHVFSEDLVKKMVDKRIATAEECFRNLHPEIVPMLNKLKEKKIRIGLISNCFSEEAQVIRRSVLAPYFDVMCLSYELGMRKPEPEIYQMCVGRLGLRPKECLYVGDGGSCELEAARQFDMMAVQATWYLAQRGDWPAKRKKEFAEAANPMDIIGIIE